MAPWDKQGWLGFTDQQWLCIEKQTTNTTPKSGCVSWGSEEGESTLLTLFIVSEKKQVAPYDPSPSHLETQAHMHGPQTHSAYTSAPTPHPFRESKY